MTRYNGGMFSGNQQDSMCDSGRAGRTCEATRHELRGTV